MIHRISVVSHRCCTEFSNPLGGSDSVVPALPSSSGKQLFHPPGLEGEGTINIKTTRREEGKRMRGELVLLSGFLFYHTKQLHSVFSDFINQKFVYGYLAF